jgi:hypothetical protein
MDRQPGGAIDYDHAGNMVRGGPGIDLKLAEDAFGLSLRDVH